jgi:hypothetical protein
METGSQSQMTIFRSTIQRRRFDRVCKRAALVFLRKNRNLHPNDRAMTVERKLKLRRSREKGERSNLSASALSFERICLFA